MVGQARSIRVSVSVRVRVGVCGGERAGGVHGGPGQEHTGERGGGLGLLCCCLPDVVW